MFILNGIFFRVKVPFNLPSSLTEQALDVQLLRPCDDTVFVGKLPYRGLELSTLLQVFRLINSCICRHGKQLDVKCLGGVGF